MNQIESKREKRWEPPVTARPRLEQTNQQGREEGKQAESRDRLALMRINKSMDRERGDADDNKSPLNAPGDGTTQV